MTVINKMAAMMMPSATQKRIDALRKLKVRCSEDILPLYEEGYPLFSVVLFLILPLE